jgi:tyrosine-protein phosphatase SIW14
VTLRDTPDPRPTNLDRAEDDYCAAHDILHVRLSPGAWQNVEDPTAPAPVEENVRKFLAVMADPKNHPVLVHCFAGIHRTGAYTALYRMEFEHWTHDRALEEMRACGYTTLDEEFDILGYLEHFRPTGFDKRH